MKQNEKFITIFTPTFNRKSFLERVFDSLKRQSNKDFIWLVVDDGSIDGTCEYVSELKKQADFEVEYVYQTNGGKHRAHNTAVSKCKTNYILILDSDDYLTSDAINVLTEKVKLLNDDVAGIIGNRIDSMGEIIGTPMPNIALASGNELYQKYGLVGDTLRLYKTHVLKQFLFPEIEGEKFVSENVVFDKIDQKYKLLVIQERLYIGEYQKEGYTSNIYGVHLRNPLGYALSLRSSVETAVTIKKKISYMILYSIWCNKMMIKFEIEGFFNKIIGFFLKPIVLLCIKLKFPAFFFKHFQN